MGNALAEGKATLARLTAAALARLLDKGGPAAVAKAESLLTDDERQQLAAQLAATNATADLLGRARIRERADGGLFSDQAATFSTITRHFDGTGAPGTLAPMAPREAVEFFRSLVPTLSITDAAAFAAGIERESFALAVATDLVLTERVKAVIAERLESGEVSTGPAAIQALLDEAGVSSANPQYAEMVFRTNLLDSYNVGAQRELAEVASSFPWYRYSNPNDGRSRPKHAALDGKYFLSTTPFVSVRGTDISDAANCRCTFIPVHRLEVLELERAGISPER